MVEPIQECRRTFFEIGKRPVDGVVPPESNTQGMMAGAIMNTAFGPA